MRKVNYLVFVSLFAILVSCTEKKVVEKPSFSGYKNAVSFDVFNEQMNTITENNEILSAGIEDTVPSFESKGTTKITIDKSYTRSGQAKTMSFYSSSVNSSIDASSSFDSNNKVFNYSGKKTYVQNEKYYNNEEITEIAETAKKDFHLEKATFEEGGFVAILNKNSHLMSNSLFEDTNIDFLASYVATTTLFVDNGRIPNIFDWLKYTEVERGYFKFYNDKNVLTCVMDKKFVSETKEDVDGVEKVSARITKNESRTLQLSVEKNEVKYKDYIEVNEKTELIAYKDSYTYIDTRETKTVKSTDSYIRLNDKVSLSAENQANYREGREVVTSIFFSYSSL